MSLTGKQVASLTLAMIAAAPSLAPAETFRCGSRLVSQDSSVAELVARCGEPSRKSVKDVQPLVNNGGLMHRLPTTVRTEIWTYDRGSRSFGMVVTIVEGKITRMESAK